MKEPKKAPFLTIVTVTLNNSNGLQKTLKSIQDQDSNDYELIVVDGGSTDNTAIVIEKFSAIISFYKSEKDRGISHAFNKGTELAKGKVINYLNSGDIYISSSVISMVKTSYYKNSWRWAYGLRKRIDIKNRIFNARKNEQIQYSFDNLKTSKLLISHQATFFETQVVQEMKMYDEFFQFLVMDYDLMLKIGQKYPPIEFGKYLVLYEDFGISAKMFLRSLQLKRYARIRNLKLGRRERFFEITNIYVKYIKGKFLSLLKRIIIKIPFTKKLMNQS